MKFGDGRRLTSIGKGCLKDGYGYWRKSPVISVTFPADLLERIRGEALREGLPFAEIVRRRLRASYWLKARKTKA